jgi:hypothetical protein
VHNLTVAGAGSFLAGAAGVVVHNCDCGFTVGPLASDALPPARPYGAAPVPGSHNLRVRYLDVDSRTLARHAEVSGGMTAVEKTVGGWKGAVGHTERRVVQRPVPSGTHRIVMAGDFAPCPGCRAAMNRFARRTGIEVIYLWRGQLTFRGFQSIESYLQRWSTHEGLSILTPAEP